MSLTSPPKPDEGYARLTTRRPILIVDDERRMADSMRDLLRSIGFGAEVAYGGAEAIERLEDRHFPVVVTDLRMPGVGGIDLIHYLRQRQPHTLVIVATAYASTDSAIEALHCHAFDYISKPFEFERLRRSVERAFQKIETDQLREDAAVMISHDIKIPLTSIIGFAAMLYDAERGEYHPRAAEFAETIEANGQKILELVDNYLTSCKVESGTLQTNPMPVNPAVLVRDVVSSAVFSARRRQCEIVESLDGLPRRILADEYLLYRAIANLMHNAIKYNDAKCDILIEGGVLEEGETPWAGPSVYIAMENQGPNFPQQELERIFTRYRRGRLAGGIEGSGIGLYVVRAVAEAHGGDAVATMAGLNRIRFTLRLPLLLPTEDNEAFVE